MDLGMGLGSINSCLGYYEPHGRQLVPEFEMDQNPEPHPNFLDWFPKEFGYPLSSLLLYENGQNIWIMAVNCELWPA